MRRKQYTVLATFRFSPDLDIDESDSSFDLDISAQAKRVINSLFFFLIWTSTHKQDQHELLGLLSLMCRYVGTYYSFLRFAILYFKIVSYRLFLLFLFEVRRLCFSVTFSLFHIICSVLVGFFFFFLFPNCLLVFSFCVFVS